MSADDAGASGAERRVMVLVGQLGESRPERAIDTARILARARRQRAALVVVQLLVTVARSVPDALSRGRGAGR